MAKKKRKKYQMYPLGMKQQAVARMQAGTQVTTLAEELRVHRSLLYEWRRKALDQLDGQPGGPQDLQAQRIRELAGHVAQLEGALGRKTQEIDFFAAALRRCGASRQPSGKRGGTVCTEKSADKPKRKAD